MQVNSKICGYFTLEAVKMVDGKEIRRKLVDRFPNLITDIGLNRMGTNADYLGRCYVGSSSAVPVVTDTAMGNLIAWTATISTSSTGIHSTSPYYAWVIKTYRFAEGVAAGNLSEVGIGYLDGTYNRTFSRALIVDALGDPTTITVLSDETLDVTYECRLYPKETDDTGSVTLTGNIGGTYDWIFRPARINTANNFPQFMSYIDFASAFDGNIGAITSYPAGNVLTLSSAAKTYVAYSNEIGYTISASLTQGNLTGGIRSILLRAGPQQLQVQFNPKIPKTATDILTLNFVHRWGRA
jgi:hypothetical protein